MNRKIRVEIEEERGRNNWHAAVHIHTCNFLSIYIRKYHLKENDRVIQRSVRAFSHLYVAGHQATQPDTRYQMLEGGEEMGRAPGGRTRRS